MSDFVHKIGFERSTYDNDKRDSKLLQFIDEKMDKHMGFILEAAIGAFPQSILQMSITLRHIG